MVEDLGGDMFRRSSLLSALILSLVSTGIQALGLGDIHLHSALNQNLKADIDLLSVEQGGIADVRVSLASSEAFTRAGVERTFMLSRLRFKAERLPNGSAVLHVTTLEPVREPFLNFLIEANWAKGRMIREYTVLLDPPVTLGRKPAPVVPPKAAVAPPPKKKPIVTPPPVVEPEPAPAVEPAQAAEAEETPVEPKPAAEDVAMADDVATSAAGDYSVVRGDTLWGIVGRSRINGVSDKQLMMAIYRANPHAFFGNNINNLKAGEILRIPGQDESMEIEVADANSQYREHVDIWMAAKRGETVEAAAEDKIKEAASEEQIASTDEESDAAKEEDATVAKEKEAPASVEQSESEVEVATGEKVEEATPDAELKIATPRPEGEGEAGLSEGGEAEETLARVKQELLLAQEEVASSKQEGIELQSRVGDLESQVTDLQRLITLKSEQLATLQAHAAAGQEAVEAEAVEAETEPTESETATIAESEAVEVTPLAPPVESEPVEIEKPAVAEVETAAPVAVEEPKPAVEPSVESEAPATPVAKVAPPPARQKPEPVDEPGFMDSILGNATMLGIGGGVIAAILGLFMFMSRRKGGDVENFEESILLDSSDMEDVESTLEEVVEEPGHTEDTSFLSDFSPSDIDALQDETGEVDPLSEADVYISYGRYQQAEELIRQAVEKDPNRHLLQHKLFDILYALKSEDEFVKLAEASVGTPVETSDAAAWKKILSMGSILAADNALFAGAEPLEGAVEQSIDDLDDIDDALDDDMDDFDLDGIAAELDAEEAANLEAASELEGLKEDDEDMDLDLDLSGLDTVDDLEVEGEEIDLSEMDAAEETTLDIGPMVTEDEDDSLDDLDLADLDDDVDMLVDISTEDGAEDSSILTDLSESELVSLDVDEAGEVDTKIDLARAYIDMGDPDGAKDILDEVLGEGNDSQKEEAEKLKDQIS